ncbi:MAG: CobW-like GTP-binding protein [Firmicutes bacterium]|nr:CobW-like GTP-binding protein [Bacillota bacterium]
MNHLRAMAGAVTAITGFEKGSGKTTFLGHALPQLRAHGPVAVFTIGVDGAQKARESRSPASEIRVEPGDVVMTTQPFAHHGSARLEVLEALPGRSSLGHLFLGRVVRGGSVTLVGSDHLSVLADVVARVREEGLATSVVVDGAVNRLTQVGALGEVGYIVTARVDRSNLLRAAAHLRHFVTLAGLPIDPHPASDVHRMEDVLDADRLARLPSEVKVLSVEDFTKIFLDPALLARTLERRAITVRRGFRLLGLAVTLRDVERDELKRALGEAVSEQVIFNPYEAA